MFNIVAYQTLKTNTREEGKTVIQQHRPLPKKFLENSKSFL